MVVSVARTKSATPQYRPDPGIRAYPRAWGMAPATLVLLAEVHHMVAARTTRPERQPEPGIPRLKPWEDVNGAQVCG